MSCLNCGVKLPQSEMFCSKECGAAHVRNLDRSLNALREPQKPAQKPVMLRSRDARRCLEIVLAHRECAPGSHPEDDCLDDIIKEIRVEFDL